MLIKWPTNSSDPILSDVPLYTSSQGPGLSLVSNGYIANQAELINRYGLSRQSSVSDLLLFLFQKIGPVSSARSIAGPCSWIVWDATQKLLFVVSDHMGLAPLYYAKFANCLWIADDMDLLLEKARLPHQVNPRAIVARIHLLPIPEDETLFQGVFRFMPGTVWSCVNDHASCETYWRAELRPALRLKNDQEYAEALRALLIQVVNEHVPHEQFALTLSSGMDSSSIAGALRLARPNDHLPCLGWTMPEIPASNEEEGIRATSHKLDLDLTLLQADQYWPLKSDIPCANLPQSIIYQEVWIATYLEMQKQGVHILIDGDMGDQCFGGSILSHSDLLLGLRWYELTKQIQQEWTQGYYCQPDWKMPLYAVVRPLKSYIGGLLPPTFPFRKRVNPASWLHPSQRAVYEQAIWARQPPFKIGLPGRVLRWWRIINPSNCQSILRYHKLAQKFGIELRHPFWDHRVLEFALQLPSEQTYQAGIQKIILRNAMRDVLPNRVVGLRRKIYPIDLHRRGLRERSIEQVQDLMTDMRLADMGYILPSVLQTAYQRYLDGETDDDHFFAALMLESEIRAWG